MRVSKALFKFLYSISVYIIILYENFMGGMLIDRSVRTIRKSVIEPKNNKKKRQKRWEKK